MPRGKGAGFRSPFRRDPWVQIPPPALKEPYRDDFGINTGTGINTKEMKSFERFCLVKLQLANETAERHARHIEQFIRFLEYNLESVTAKDVEDFMMEYQKGRASKTYGNMLCSFKVFFRDYLKRGDLVADFKFPKIIIKPKFGLPNKKEFKVFYDALPTIREKVIFLMYTTTGLRYSEVLGLTFDDVDLSMRMVIPNNHHGTTKRSWVSFYNSECDDVLNEYLKKREGDGHRIFPLSRTRISTIYSATSKKVGIYLTPQILQGWFCSEVGRLGVQDRYIDAFCGRVPGSVLARHYTDFNPERLKEIYENADLKVLS